MRVKHLHLFVLSILAFVAFGLGSGEIVWAQNETPTETPGETPTATPQPAEPTPTESPSQAPRITVSGQAVNVGDEVVITLQAANFSSVDAFGFDVELSENILTFGSVDTASTLVEGFLSVDAEALASPAGAVRIGAVGGPASAEGSGVLLNLVYTASEVGSTIVSITNAQDDLSDAVVASGVITVRETGVDTPTPTVPPEETVTPQPEATATPTPPVGEGSPVPVYTPVTPSPTFTPEPTPTALHINPVFGLVSLDELGGTYPRGSAVHNFDVGLSDFQGNLFAPGVFDGFVDPRELGPFLFIDGVPYPIAKDMEFTGETVSVDDGGNGSEGIYFLIGGNIGPYAPVNPRLGATGGPNGGGIDWDNDPTNNINFGTFTGDIIPVLSFGPNDFASPLVDLEPAGNGGFYVLADNGRLVAEGDALEALDSELSLNEDATAVGLKIFRGRDIVTTNSLYSDDIIGTGAYVLDSQGFIHAVGDNTPELNTENIPVVPDEEGIGAFADIEFMPNADGSQFIGLSVLRGDGVVYFVPFADVEVTDEITEHVNDITPFNNLENAFPFDIARDLEIEVTTDPSYGMDSDGNTIVVNPDGERRVGTFVFDGFGGSHTGGESTRFSAAFGGGDYIIPSGGQEYNAFPFPVNPPYFTADITQDTELVWPVNRAVSQN